MGKKLGGERMYSGRIINVDLDEVSLPNGMTVQLEVIRHPGAAAIIPWHADGSITLVHQYRYAAGGFIHEIPAGKLDPGETPEACAARELEEEAGLRAGQLHSLGSIFTTPGFTDELIHLFAATNLEAVGQRLEPDEVIELQRMPLADALRMATDGRMQDSKSLCALFRLQQERDSGRLQP